MHLKFLAILLLPMEVSGTAVIEQLFLDLPIAAVHNRTVGMDVIEPWASLYCSAISEARYGDAIYARYNIDGQANNGVYVYNNITVYDQIMLDARDYANNQPELYATALVLYNSTASNDSRQDIINGLNEIPMQA
ncbi:hypothetical protein BJY01DRAFT_227662 [Aspergillus pseudoustus]|uniref:Uncharacterized protein n=1 Tax=Aspergillus pseudoustus TaxID=1810923 RepID=A0ABR4IQ31_9EURO